MRTDTHLYLICTLPEIVGLFFRPRPRQADEKQPQMLDAAHGERIGALAVVQRLHRPGVEPQVPCLLIAGKERRRSPVPTVRADVPQGSRRRVAVARSRRKEQSLKGMRRRGNKFNSQFRMQNSQLMDSLREFDSTVVILRSIRRRIRIRVFFTVPAFQACPAGCDRPTLTTLLVILNEVKNLFPCEPKAADGLCRPRRRKTNEVQSRICLRILLYRFFVDLPISSE